jgi:hypothetical protein
MRTCSPIFEVNGSTMTLMSVMLHNTHRRAQQAYSVRANSVIEYGSNHSDFVQRCEPEFRLETKIVYASPTATSRSWNYTVVCCSCIGLCQCTVQAIVKILRHKLPDLNWLT